MSALGSAALPSIVQAALQSSQQRTTFPQALLHQAHSIDQQGAQLLSHRGQGILAGLAGLQAYSAALRLVLGQSYPDSSHHSQWASAAEAAVASISTEVCIQQCSPLASICAKVCLELTLDRATLTAAIIPNGPMLLRLLWPQHGGADPTVSNSV